MAIKATVLEKNGYPYMECLSNLPVMSIPYFDDLQVVGEFYAVPVKDGGIHRGYSFVAAASAPTPDSFKVTRAYDRITSEYYTIVANQSAVEGAADGDTIAPNTIPVVVPDSYACQDPTSGNYFYQWVAPTKVGSDEYRAWVIVDNVQGVVGLSTGHSSVSAMVTWLNTNYSGAGTWSNPSGNIVKLVSSTNKKVGLAFEVGNFS